jgi:biotin transporter BioY
VNEPEEERIRKRSKRIVVIVLIIGLVVFTIIGMLLVFEGFSELYSRSLWSAIACFIPGAFVLFMVIATIVKYSKRSEWDFRE